MTDSATGSHIHKSKVIQRRVIAPGLVVLKFENPFLAQSTSPGQFVNVLPKIGFTDPLLRRPFSIYHIEADCAEIIIQDHGRGTNIISNTREGEYLDVLGPLGNPWKYKSGNYKTAILLIGGVGVASMPLLIKRLQSERIKFVSYYGARTSNLFADEYISNVEYSTDDGSKGYQGSVIENLRKDLRSEKYEAPKLFVCGPTGMMRASITLANEFQIPCEVSLETEMACGIGICQGCPIESSNAEFERSGRKFHLVCTHGPSFEKESIIL
jgi:dihydroorotate dehydrogenase electron transfer subunit